MLDRGVVILFNLPRAAAANACAESDAGILRQVAAVADALCHLGIPHRRAGVYGLTDVPAALAAGDEEIVVNLVESLAGDERDMAFVPEVARAMGRSCTGNDGTCQALCHDKWRANAVLRGRGVPTPAGVCVPAGQRAVPGELPAGPLIIKPLHTDASEGITAASVVESCGAALDEAVRRVHEQFDQPALVEQYIDGRELNVSVIDIAGGARTLPVAEIEFVAYPPGKPRIVDYAAKWLPESFEYRNTPRRIPAALDPAAAAQVQRLALEAWAAVGGRDYARVDFRLAADGRPYVLEVNPNPDLSPDAGFAAALEAVDIPFEAFVKALIENALSRAHPAPIRPAGGDGAAAPGADAGTALQVRWSEPADHKPILAMLTNSGYFRPDEIAVGREVLDEALAKGPTGHYQSYTALVDGEPAGWVCFGPTPCTVGTYDVYWIAVDRRRRRGGIGAALLSHAERLIAGLGGLAAVAETSGRALYEPTRRFYLKCGYHEAARVSDFYAPGDDKVVYVKRLQ